MHFEFSNNSNLEHTFFSGPYGQFKYIKCVKEYDNADFTVLKVSKNNKTYSMPLLCKKTHDLYEMYTPYGFNPIDWNLDFNYQEIDNLKKFLFEQDIIRLFVRSNLDGVTGFGNNNSELVRKNYRINLRNKNNSKCLFNGKRRNEFRKCEKKGVFSKIFSLGDVPINLLEQCFIIYADLMRQKSASYLKFNYRFFEALLRGCIQGDLLVLFHNQCVVSFSIFLTDLKIASYHLSAGNIIPGLSLTSFGLQTMAAHYAERGLDYLHLGGGNYSGDKLDDFKKKMSNEIIDYRIFNLNTNSKYDNQLRRSLAINNNLMFWEQI